MKTIGKWLSIVFLVIVIGTLLITTVFYINSPNLEKHLEESKETLAKESVYYQVDGTETSTLDNYTDALMLFHASYRGEESILKKAMNIYREYREDTSPYEQLTEEDETVPTIIISYYRYWHGYIVFLRPLLTFFNYAQIREINGIMQGFLLMVFIGLMIKRKLGIYLIPILSTYWLINPISIAMSLQNSTIWYITLISCIIYLLYQDRIIKYQVHYLLFTVVGMVTSFMDLLTYPVVTLGLLLLIVLIAENLSFSEALRRIIVCGFCWTLGYGIMWFAKWVLATLILKENVIQHAFNQVSYRSSNLTWGDVEVSRLGVVKKTLMIFNLPVTKAVIILNFISMIGIVLYYLKDYQLKDFFKRIMNAIPIFLVSFATIIWYLVLTNHTQIHPFLSFRTAYVFFCAILLTPYQVIWMGNTKKFILNIKVGDVKDEMGGHEN